MPLFQDNADTTRFVEPISRSGKKTICRIYWDISGKLAFGGKISIPTALMDPNDRRNERIGFTLCEE